LISLLASLALIVIFAEACRARTSSRSVRRERTVRAVREQTQLADAFQRVHSPVIEGETGCERQGAGRLGDEDLVRLRSRHDASGFVHRDPANVATNDFDFADVHAGADVESVAFCAFTNCRSAAQRNACTGCRR
jgi:hypothetical protein